MLERMNDFFNNRLEEYERHQLQAIDSARDFYSFTANCLPVAPHCTVLDLGCGTGLELQDYFNLNPTAKVTGIDIAQDMLRVMQKKFGNNELVIIQGSYFDIPFEDNYYNAVVSVESLHHFTKEEKIPLYKKILRALAPGGYFILTDYFASSNEEEDFLRQEFLRLKIEQGICDNEMYHYDIPLTVEHELQTLQEAGFSTVEILKQWGVTRTIKAY